MSNRLPAATSLPTSGGYANEKGGLFCTVLSVYDLPAGQEPVAVTMRVSGMLVSTGAPTSRHKDHNSFRFNGGNNSDTKKSGELSIRAPLRDLYASTAELAVEFSNPELRLVTKVKLDTVVVHETQWLILDLEGKGVKDLDVAPTLRLKLRLDGPYRAEIAALVAVGQGWFGVMDQIESSWSIVVKKVRESGIPTISPKYILIPVVPLATALVILSPILAGVAVVALPVFVPILVVLASVLFGGLAVGSVVYFSTSSGRDQLSPIVSPVSSTFLSTKAGQSLVYDTGPRPTPVSVARIVVPRGMWGRLVVSLAIDLTGSASYLLPMVGEAFDVAWAPVQTVFIMAMYDTVAPNLKYVSFVEEILPFTDVVPSAMIGWFKQYGPDLFSSSTRQFADSFVPPTSAVQRSGASLRQSSR